ncbi:glycoside hydrolase family 172 protein [uncultured Bacteroides sp.]|uniref:glycoside hydrolase family 172 protein n=1 Tax=uncultured Bacteroides sp. TaxID=162156 RepID=UPI0026328337|nr:glycoside hydrolase family 172 protein [uncultured Bacteroides sp.]
MKINNKILAPTILSAMLSVSGYSQEITMQDFLREMVDRERIAEYPENLQYRTLQASSYNRASVSPDQPGWFADSDGVFCIRTEKNKKGETEWVLMEDDGPGVITKMWAVCFYYGLDNTTGANVKIYLDGKDEPEICCNFFELVQGKAFIKSPLAAETRRAGNCYLPIPYEKGCKITMDKKVFYNIINYRSYPKGTKIKSFSMDDFYNSTELIDSVNNVLARGCVLDDVKKLEFHKTLSQSKMLGSGDEMKLSLDKSFKGSKSGAVRFLTVKIKAENEEQALRSTILKAKFDGEQTIWSPVGDFFNIGVGMKHYKMWERAVEPDGTMVCRWVMPYRNNAELCFENLGSQKVNVEASVTYGPYNWTDNSMYFHSTWRMDDPTPGFPLFDYNLVNVKGTGIYVGDQFTVLNPEQGWWGEGDEKVYVDDDTFPSHFGTGTEDYYGWAGGVVPNPVDEFDEPFLSNVRVASPNSMGYNTCTRTRVLDAIPFNRQIDFNIESSGSNRTSWFHLQYAVNTYWYAKPGAVSNRAPLPEMASRKIMTLEELRAFNDECKSNKYVYPGAIEAENIETYVYADGVTAENKVNVWGELSNGDAKGFSFSEKGQTVSVRLTELFDKTNLKICFITDSQSGEFDVFLNGKFVKTVNLSAEHSAVSTIEFGEFEPVENAVEIKFVSKRAGKLGIDYYLNK